MRQDDFEWCHCWIITPLKDADVSVTGKQQRPCNSGTMITGQGPPCDKQKQEAPPQTPFPACLLSCLLMSVSTGRDGIGQVIQPHVTAASVQCHLKFKGGLNVSYRDVLTVTTWSSERIYVYFPVGH